MHYAIFGSGAIGGYFGFRLAQSGQQVSFIARGDTLRVLTSDGLRLVTPEHSEALSPAAFQASDRPEEVGPVDVVLVCVKTWQVAEAARQMRPLLGERTVVLPLENGVEAALQIAEVVGPTAVLGGLCRIAAEVVRPGTISHVGIEPSITLGELDKRSSERAARVRDSLASAGIRAEVAADIELALWEKFLFIAAFGGVGAITQQPAGVIRQEPVMRRMLTSAMREIWSVGRARGVSLDEAAVDRTLQFFDALPPETTASMQRDILQGRPSELEAQTGAVVRLARQSGVATPVNDGIYAALLPLEQRAHAGRSH